MSSTSSGTSGDGSGKSGETGQSNTGKSGRNESINQARERKDDEIITGTNQGALGQGAMSRQPNDVIRSDRYKPENNPERNPEPVIGNEDRQTNKSTTTDTVSNNSQQEKRDWE